MLQIDLVAVIAAVGVFAFTLSAGKRSRRWVLAADVALAVPFALAYVTPGAILSGLIVMSASSGSGWNLGVLLTLMYFGISSGAVIVAMILARVGVVRRWPELRVSRG